MRRMRRMLSGVLRWCVLREMSTLEIGEALYHAVIPPKPAVCVHFILPVARHGFVECLEGKLVSLHSYQHLWRSPWQATSIEEHKMGAFLSQTGSEHTQSGSWSVPALNFEPADLLFKSELTKSSGTEICHKFAVPPGLMGFWSQIGIILSSFQSEPPANSNLAGQKRFCSSMNFDTRSPSDVLVSLNTSCTVPRSRGNSLSTLSSREKISIMLLQPIICRIQRTRRQQRSPGFIIPGVIGGNDVGSFCLYATWKRRSACVVIVPGLTGLRNQSWSLSTRINSRPHTAERV